MKYEYKYIYGVDSTRNVEEAWGLVEEAGKEGWELVAVRQTADSVVYYFKRTKHYA